MEESSDDNRESWMTRFLWILAWTFAIYILFFELIVLDECWLKTFFITKHAPPWAEEALRTIYAPLLSVLCMTSHTVTPAP